MTQQERDQWAVHVAYLRERARTHRAAGQYDRARGFAQDARAIEERVKRESAAPAAPSPEATAA